VSTKRFILLLLLLVCWGQTVGAQKKVRIACVGNSITFGHGLPQREQNSFPAQLQALLGAGYEVRNFGVSSKTVIRAGADPYMATPQYQEALQSKPDLVFIKLGTNDSRLPYRNFIDSFIADYKTLIHAFRSLPTQPRVVLLLPVASFLQDTSRQTDAAIKKYILPRIRQVAFAEKLEVIDLYSLTVDQPGLFPDKLHPDTRGAALIAQRLQEVVLGKAQQGFDIFQ
jgi:lysophospholipase L1-like esterase